MKTDRRLHFGSFLDEVEAGVDRYVGHPEELYAQQPKQRHLPRAACKIDGEIEKQAQNVLKNKKVLRLLCPVLKTVASDSFEVAKVSTPILLTLVLSHTITLPLIPSVFAAVAVLVSRMGVAALCEEYNKKEGRKKT